MGIASLFGLDIAAGAASGIKQQQLTTRATRHSRKFAEYMSNTAYQRAVADLTKAGLNPMLAYTQGGASTPGYQVGAIPSVDFGGFGAAAEKGVSTAMKMRGEGRASGRYPLEQEGLKAGVEKARSDAQTAATTAKWADMQNWLALENAKREGARLESDTWLKRAQADQTAASTKYMGTQDRALRLSIPYSEEQEQWARSTPVGDASRAVLRAIERTSSTAKEAGQAVSEGVGRWLRGAGSAAPKDSGW